MLLKILLIVAMGLFGVIGMALIYGGQYLYKEKSIKSGLRQGFYNSTIDDYPENKLGAKLLRIGQILVLIDLAIIILYSIL